MLFLNGLAIRSMKEGSSIDLVKRLAYLNLNVDFISCLIKSSFSHTGQGLLCLGNEGLYLLYFFEGLNLCLARHSSFGICVCCEVK